MKSFSRAGGILLHISALPGRQGIGTLGKAAYDFIDFLAQAQIKLWQICPLGPTGFGDSPYQSFSAFAGNPLFIDLEKLREKGLLNQAESQSLNDLPTQKVDYGALIPRKKEILNLAFQRFVASSEFDKFCTENKVWLDDFAFFMALKEHFDGICWTDWPREIKLREEEARQRYAIELAERIQYFKFVQFTFFEQWQAVRAYANERNIKILGDMPIFIAFDSADAWANKEIFYFDENCNPTLVAGVPPDYFSSTGQLWGNPLYNWEKLQEDNFSWWKLRFFFAQQMYDSIRIDHFRGFVAYWAVPAAASTAEQGSWKAASGDELFQELARELGELLIVAEDLGVITAEVTALRKKYGFPGMKVLQFAFQGGDQNPYLPHNYKKSFVAYTGTHDNDTTRGWFEKISIELKRRVCSYLNCKPTEICPAMLHAIWQSKADWAIAPLQDFLELGSEARFNTPGVAGGNWQWRLDSAQITPELTQRIRKLTIESKR
ncbi:MAG: 4-alpha-glucanotransferase [Candidatus Cloacimonadales bacterium]